MRTIRMLSGMAALAAAALSTMPPAVAATRAIAPMADKDCRAFADGIGRIFGVTLAMSTSAPGEDSIVQDVKGKACMASGTATGLTITFDKANDAVVALLKGWKPEPYLAADGPDSTIGGYRKGNAIVVYSLDLEPPAGKCDDVMPDECTVPPKQWVWTIGLTAFTYTGR